MKLLIIYSYARFAPNKPTSDQGVIIMTILVTGATGTVGGHVVEQLVKRGADVRALVRDPSKADFPAEVGVVQGDLLDVDSLRSGFQGVSTLFQIGRAHV